MAENYDTEAELKLFSKNGDLLSHTLHNTYKGNSYMMSPSADITVRDGTIGAINRMAKDMGLEENN